MKYREQTIMFFDEVHNVSIVVVFLNQIADFVGGKIANHPNLFFASSRAFHLCLWVKDNFHR